MYWRLLYLGWRVLDLEVNNKKKLWTEYIFRRISKNSLWPFCEFQLNIKTKYIIHTSIVHNIVHYKHTNIDILQGQHHLGCLTLSVVSMSVFKVFKGKTINKIDFHPLKWKGLSILRLVQKWKDPIRLLWDPSKRYSCSFPTRRVFTNQQLQHSRNEMCSSLPWSH